MNPINFGLFSGGSRCAPLLVCLLGVSVPLQGPKLARPCKGTPVGLICSPAFKSAREVSMMWSELGPCCRGASVVLFEVLWIVVSGVRFCVIPRCVFVVPNILLCGSQNAVVLVVVLVVA